MEKFTIFGYYDDTGQVFSESIFAADAYAAMRLIAEQSEAPDTLCIIGAVLGEQTIITPGEDNGSSAFACDLIEPYTCQGCGREESVCSEAPCPDVIADREA